MSREIERLDDLVGDASPGVSAPYATPRSSPDTPTTEALQRRAALVALVVLSGLALGVFGLLVSGGTDNTGWLAVTIVFLTGLVLLYKKFEIGLLLFVSVCWIAIGTPNVATGGSGFGRQLLLSQVGLVVLLLLWATRRFVRREWKLYSTPINVPIGLFLLVCFWSTLNSFLFRDPNVQIYSTKQFFQVNVIDMGIRVLSLGALLMIGNTLQGRELRWTALALLVPGVLTFTKLLPFVPASPYLAFPQLITMAILSAFVLTKQGKLWLRVLCGLIAVGIFSFYVISATEWASGWISALTALAVIVFVASRRLFWVGCVVFAIAVLLNADYLYQKIYQANLESASFERFDLLRASFLYAAHFPLGIGLGNYRSYNAYYGELWGTTTYTSAHGMYAQTLTETGWPGLFCLLLLLAAVTRMLYRYYKALPEGFLRSYTLGALGAFVGICLSSFIGDYLFPAYHNDGVATFGSTVYTFFMIGVVIAMAREQGIAWQQAREEIRTQAPAPIYNRGPYADAGQQG